MIEDICDYLDIVPEYLREKIEDMGDKAIVDDMFNCSKFVDLSERFIAEHNNDPLDEVYLCHLARSIDVPKILLPLPDLLTTKNSFSDFLQKHNIQFAYDENRFEMYYKGRKVSDFSRAPRLKIRLGHYDEPDFCVNGFAFAIEPKISTDGYYDRLFKGPELLQDIDDCLDKTLSKDFRKISNYYLVIVKVPLSDIIFDEREDLNVPGDRTKMYLSACFEFLLAWYSKGNYCCYLHNEKLRLSDYTSIEVDHCIKLD